ncbi:replication protein A 70 kDa DNA-binding subunit C-like [Senna tora]|uniref:Replication protein A 70 kDa DNA-binding subunit C-like n=1 Tax=Senna tora TaxID=362788 RepID=A0A834X0K8_9FABA|nr:replication protein A 70 kDa DNA-binding subunit C-like [Senna tora]
MASRNQPLTSMNPMQHQDTTVKVRGVHLWCVPPYSSNTSKPNPGAIVIQMVLCDSENYTIGASVPSMYLNKFKGSLVEGGVYFISRFGVGDSGGNFRITTHAFKINFQFERDLTNMAVNAKFRKYIALHIMLGHNLANLCLKLNVCVYDSAFKQHDDSAFKNIVEDHKQSFY